MTVADPVRSRSGWFDPAVADLAAALDPDDVDAALALAPRLHPAADALGTDTRMYLSTLATLGAVDLTVARAIEPHLDALAILRQAGPGVALDALGAGPDATWGVYAAAAPGRRVDARPPVGRGGTRAGTADAARTADATASGRAEVEAPATWSLSGAQPWCSLAGRLSHALVVAHVGGVEVGQQDDRTPDSQADRPRGSEVDRRGGPASGRNGDAAGGASGDRKVGREGDTTGGTTDRTRATGELPAVGARRLFAIPLRDSGVRASADPWVGRGLTAITSGGIELDDVPGVPVGGDGWYLSRPGFAWGAVGVAAVWFGAAAALADSLRAAAGRRAPDQIALWHLGTTDALLYGAELALRDAADRIDAGAATGTAGQVLAARVRAVVAEAAERVLVLVGHALGPGPLVGDAQHARRVADLTVYLRQHHAERDLARLGELTLSPPQAPHHSQNADAAEGEADAGAVSPREDGPATARSDEPRPDGPHSGDPDPRGPRPGDPHLGSLRRREPRRDDPQPGDPRSGERP